MTAINLDIGVDTHQLTEVLSDYGSHARVGGHKELEQTSYEKVEKRGKKETTWGRLYHAK